jgi:hypothetical protein
MRKGFKLTAVMAGLLVATAGTSGVFANCSNSIIPVFQCGFVGYFAPPPAGAGTVSAIWWQLGYGNNNVNNGTTPNSTQEGTGIAPAGVFQGNDSGIGTIYLTDADTVLPDFAAQIPDGSLCSNFENSWAGGGIDGCADNVRTTASLDNDNILNPYFGYYGPCPYAGYPCDSFYTTNYQVDYPMAFLVRESTNRFFSLAFVASKARVGDGVDKAADISENFYDLATVTNGDPNPAQAGRNNMIPWQPVPKPRVDSVTGTTPGTPRQLALSWDNVRLVHDGSTRPTGTRSAAPVVNGGVGVLNQATQAGGLCRFQLQTAPLTTNNPTPDPSTLTWANAGTEIACGGANPVVTANLTVNPDTAVRVRTILGKKPRTTSTLIGSTRVGASGDLGFEPTDCKANNCVNSPPLLIVGGGLVSEQAVETVAARNKNAVEVTFRTTSELTVSSIDILGKGDTVLKTVACKQCTTGIGDQYSVLLNSGELKGSKELKVRLNGPGAVSSSFPIQ